MDGLLNNVFGILPTGIIVRMKRWTMVVSFIGQNQNETRGIMVSNKFLLPLALSTENHLMTVMVMRQNSMYQHHDAGESDSDTCNLALHCMSFYR